MTWWQRLWRRKQMEEQLEKELRFHLDQHASELIARGHAPEEARRLARLAFGGPEQVKEECRDARGTRWLENLLLLFGIFAGLALLLACVGIYGVLAYLTGQRVPEFGVRMALGAGARDVMWLVLRQSLGMIFAGVGVGIAGALAAGVCWCTW